MRERRARFACCSILPTPSTSTLASDDKQESIAVLVCLFLPPRPADDSDTTPLSIPFPPSTRSDRPMIPRLSLSLLLLALVPSSLAVKFQLQASHSPTQKCLWNYAMSDTLVVISVSAPIQGALQRLDMEVVDGSGSRNVYQSKKGLKGETRMAVTTHADADLGVCFKNVLDPCKSVLPVAL
jgi:hypothetical protein